ncbi:DNA gyrase subunit A [Ileibacterium valens]|uniref:DNA gyrase subunit A n=1 Tax=Ileibacterium valens TaxID=1862668 RepID=UPI0024BBBA6E|nr:DNA gyrase subunit A [Ileibacterium valens]
MCHKKQQLFKNTDLQVSYNYNVVAIVNKAPKQLGLLEILDAFIDHREEVVLRRSQFDYARKAARAHIVEGLIRAVSILDEIIALIRASKNKSDSKKNLIDRFSFTEEQAEAIVMLQLYRLSNTDIKELEKEAKTLQKEMKVLNGIIENKNKRHALMIEELSDMKEEFPTPRRSVLVEELEEIVIDQKAMIAKEQVMVTLSRDGYLKRVSMRSYSSGSNNGSFTGLKEGDRLVAYGEASTLDNLIVITSKGKMANIPVYTLPEAKWKEIGTHLSGFVKTDSTDKILFGWLYSKAPENLHFIFLTKYGLIKRLVSEDLPVQKGVRPATLMNVASDDEIISVQLAENADDQIILGTENGYGVRYRADQIPSSSGKSKGVRGLKLSEGDHAAIMEKDDEAYLLLEMDNGGMKRVLTEEIPSLTRPAKGQLLFKNSKNNPVHICDAWPCSHHTKFELLLGKVQECKGSDIRIMNASQSYSHPFKEQIESEGQIPALVRPLGYLHDGYWSEEEKQPTLFDEGTDVR